MAQIYNLNADPIESDLGKLQEYLKEHPYFQFPLTSLLENADAAQATEIRQRIAANVGDQTALRELFGLDSESLADFYPDMAGVHLSTNQTIDSFLDRFGSNIPAVDTPLIPVVPQMDYAGAFLSSGEDDDDKPKTLGEMAADLVATPVRRVADTETEEEPERDRTEGGGSNLTESLARIMIKNGKYEKALEIICELNLKNPKKSAYFADQIRFLKKLIMNESRK